jgi:hypothetical protein
MFILKNKTIRNLFICFILFFQNIYAIADSNDHNLPLYKESIEISDPQNIVGAAEFFIDSMKREEPIIYCSIKGEDEFYTGTGASALEAYYNAVFLYLTYPKISREDYYDELKHRLKILDEKRNYNIIQTVSNFMFSGFESAFHCLILDNCEGATNENNFKAFFKLYSEKYPEMLVAKVIYLNDIKNNPNRPEYFDENGNLIEAKLPSSTKFLGTASWVEAMLTTGALGKVASYLTYKPEPNLNNGNVITLKYQGKINGVPQYAQSKYPELTAGNNPVQKPTDVVKALPDGSKSDSLIFRSPLEWPGKSVIYAMSNNSSGGKSSTFLGKIKSIFFKEDTKKPLNEKNTKKSLTEEQINTITDSVDIATKSEKGWSMTKIIVKDPNIREATNTDILA